MKGLKFNSQICTTREQSERLIALGLKQETADMSLFRRSKNAEWEISTDAYIDWVKEILPLELGYTHEDIIPAWSLGRLLEVMRMKASSQIVPLDDTFDRLIEGIETRIKEGYFPKEYLVDLTGTDSHQDMVDAFGYAFEVMKAKKEE